jgi:hypothetical protein
MAENSEPRVALARVSGRVQAIAEDKEQVSAERLAEAFNAALESTDVDNETLYINE